VPAVAELELEKLIAGTQHVPQLHPLARFPAMRRDLSLVVSEATRFDAIEELVARLKLANLESVEHVVTYRGKQVDQGKKSVTITLVFRSSETTLTSEQVEDQVQRVVAAAQGELGAMLRT